MQPTSPTSAVGRTCPFCQTPIKPGVEVTACATCGIAHHAECWLSNGGCTTFGCAGGPRPVAPSPATAPTGTPSAPLVPGPPAVPQVARRERSQVPMLIASVAILITLMLGFLAIGQAPSPTPDSTDSPPPVPFEPAPPPAITPPEPPPAPSARPAVPDYLTDAEGVMQAFDDVQSMVDAGASFGEFLARYSAARDRLRVFDHAHPEHAGDAAWTAFHAASRAYAEAMGYWQLRDEARAANRLASAERYAERMNATFRQAEMALDDARVALENR